MLGTQRTAWAVAFFSSWILPPRDGLQVPRLGGKPLPPEPSRWPDSLLKGKHFLVFWSHSLNCVLKISSHSSNLIGVSSVAFMKPEKLMLRIMHWLGKGPKGKPCRPPHPATASVGFLKGGRRLLSFLLSPFPLKPYIWCFFVTLFLCSPPQELQIPHHFRSVAMR